MSSNTICLVCQNTQLKLSYFAKGYEIVGCDRCGFCQVAKPPTDADLDRLYASLHVDHTKFRDAQAAQRENLARLRLMQEFVAPGELVLDAGCATGDFLALAKAHYAVYGVDISDGAIKQAKARLPDIAARLASRKLENLGEEWPQFDAICLWDVIEHVRDPVSVLRILMSLIRPGGHLFLSTPDKGSLTAKVMKQHWAFMIPPLHLGYFTRSSFAYLFEKELPAQILTCRTQGKWTSLAFLFYKINQISSWLAPPPLLDWLSRSYLGHIKLYIPTNDIIYLVVKKPEQLE
jgi:2-polyprenyl-3-methyl-5-hydroxy-6-metoxy-1,4-benzoquinol methylase